MVNILIVEDEKIIALDIKNAVERFGYHVQGVVGNGREALELLEEELPHLILMDINLEGEMDGIQTVELIKGNYEIPVVYMTVSNDVETLDRAKKTEPYGYINKPVKDIEIFTTLETALYKFTAEGKLKRNERWLSAMLESIGEGIISVDIDGVITFMNRVAEQMTGWSSEKAVGRHKNEIIFKKSSTSKKRSIKLGSSSQNLLHITMQNYVLRSQYGKEIPVDINNSTVLDEKGNITGSILSINDITERVKQEEIIKKAAEEWRVTFDSLTDSVFLVNDEGEVMRCNKAAVAVLEKGYQDVVGNNVRTIFGYVGEYIYKCFLDIKNSGQTRIFEHRIGEKWFSGKFDPILKSTGQFNGAVIVLSDISEKRKAQEELERYKKHLEELVEQRTKALKSANKDLENEISLRWLIAEQMVQLKEYAEAASRSKSEFLANMSHELRTPLNSIIGFAKLLKMGIDPEDTIAYLDNIISSGEHLLSMINDILNLSKMEAGKLKIDCEKVDIMEIISVSVDIISVQAEDKTLSMQIVKEFKEEALYVFADPKRVQQIMLNLLSNAVKFTNQGGTILIKVRKNIRACFIDVIDNGIGIDKELQKTIFDKFSQADTSLSKENQGTGLGLAISKSLVESHGGHLYLKSEEGEGSTFTFSLPVYNEGRHGSSIGDETEMYPAGMRLFKILFLVTNDKHVPEAVEFFTNNKQPYMVLRRSSVTSENIKDSEVGLIIIETAENISNEQKFVETVKQLNDVPVVAISDSQNIEYKDIFLGLGYDRFYLFPVDYFDIMRDVHDLIVEKKNE